MTRLKHLLLASALAPSLLMIGLTPGVAQSPDQGDHHPRHKQEGGQDSHKRTKAQEDHGSRDAGNDEHRGKRKAGDDEHHGKRDASDDDHHGKRDAGDDDHHGKRDAGDDEQHGKRRAGDDERHGKHKGADDKRNAGDDERHDKRKLGHDERHDQRQLDDQERRDQHKLGNDERRDQHKLDDQERHDQRQLGNDERRDQRKLNDQDRRDQRQFGDQERRDQRKLGDQDRRDQRQLGDQERRNGAPGAAAGFGGGFLPPTNARGIDDLRRDRREVREGDRTYIREPGRTIVEEGGRNFIVHNEVDRFRALGLDVHRERRGDQFYETARRPNGDVIVTITDADGRMLRRLRRGPDGREIVLIDNGFGGRIRPYAEDVVVLPPPPMRLPRDRYVVDYAAAAPALLYETLVAPPLAPPPQRYTLDQIRYSPDIRSYVRQIDINSITFATGSWDVSNSQDGKLEALANAMGKAIDRNPNSVFLIEGYTDAVGNPNDNLSLSDRRAQSVAEILSKEFKIPPENLTTQGYGQQNPVENTQGPSAANRRVVVQNITPLLASGGPPPGH